MKKVHLLPNIITAFGLSCGLFVIFKMAMIDGADVDYQTLKEASGFLLLAAFADLLDGAIARVIRAESAFGGLFDSLADAISFGVAPAVIILKTLSLPAGSDLAVILTIGAMVYSVCGVLRLVRFNISSIEAKGDEDLLVAPSKNFTGLPIPAAAAAIVSFNLALSSEGLQQFFTISRDKQAVALFFACIVIGYFMISRWKFPSLKRLQIRVASFEIVFLTVIFAVLLFYGFLYHFAIAFFVVAWGYIVVAWVLSLIRLISGRQSKTLEDFEPESDDTEY